MSFKEFITEQKNTHMTHIEDKVLYGGVKGTREAILALRSLRDTFAGEHDGKVSVKWDGAPAIFAGTDPRDGKFFVAKKGIFNKSPKVYKSDSDVDADTSGDLSTKLKLALKHLADLPIKGVIQGDFLFSSDDLKTEKIKGKDYITFHPNTIVYAVPANTDMAKAVKAAKIGIVWHTSYSGKSFETMKATYGVDISNFKSTAVWSQDAMLRDMTSFTMSKKDTEEVNEYLKQAGKIFNQISGSTLRQLEANQKLAQHIETFNNTYVRAGNVVTDTRAHTRKLITWIKNKYKKEIDKRTTEKGKEAQQKALDDLLTFFSPTNRTSLEKMFELQKVIVLAKLKLINILDRFNSIKTYLKHVKNGYQTTGSEGFVAIDKLGGDAVKIVDRMEFSYANFSPDILKGWQTPRRS